MLIFVFPAALSWLSTATNRFQYQHHSRRGLPLQQRRRSAAAPVHIAAAAVHIRFLHHCRQQLSIGVVLAHERAHIAVLGSTSQRASRMGYPSSNMLGEQRAFEFGGQLLLCAPACRSVERGLEMRGGADARGHVRLKLGGGPVPCSSLLSRTVGSRARFGGPTLVARRRVVVQLFC